MGRNFVCGECGYPSRNGESCDNPACLSNPTIPETHKVKMRAAHAEHLRQKAEDDERIAFKKWLTAAGFNTF